MSAAGGLDFGRFASWLAQGIRTGHKLGLHLLSTDPEHMPPDDVALPPGKNSLKRETVLKLWGFMSFFDHLGGSGRYRSYVRWRIDSHARDQVGDTHLCLDAAHPSVAKFDASAFERELVRPVCRHLAVNTGSAFGRDGQSYRLRSHRSKLTATLLMRRTRHSSGTSTPWPDSRAKASTSSSPASSLSTMA